MDATREARNGHMGFLYLAAWYLTMLAVLATVVGYPIKWILDKRRRGIEKVQREQNIADEQAWLELQRRKRESAASGGDGADGQPR